jgi:Zn-dependent membrane protease YugP
LYLVLTVPALLFSLYAQWKVTSTYNKYAQVRSGRNMNGSDVARVLMRNENLMHVGVETTPGMLTDHYDPGAKVIRLSDGSQAPSVAAMAIVAHELGHAAQDQQGYAWLRVRSGIVPLANLGSTLGMLLFFGGMLLAGFANSGLGMSVAWAGVALMSVAVVFTLVTLPVEFDASNRARAMLQRNGLVTADEAAGVDAVLNAAALTYVAAAAQAVSQLLYWVLMLTGMRREE